MRPTLLIVLALAAASCTATRSLTPLDRTTELPLTYRASWSSTSLEPTTALDSQPGEAPTTTVEATLVEVRASELRKLLGAGQLSALELGSADTARLLDELDAQRTGQRLQLAPAADRPGEIRHAKSRAYIAGYELQRADNMGIVDPQIDVIDEGYLVRLRAKDDDRYELELVLSELQRPFPQHQLRLPSTFIDVTMQEPLCLAQRVLTEATLTAERSLVVAGIPTLDPDRARIVVLQRSALSAGGAPNARAAR